MIKLTDILFENHPLSAEVQKLEDDLKVKYHLLISWVFIWTSERTVYF